MMGQTATNGQEIHRVDFPLKNRICLTTTKAEPEASLYKLCSKTELNTDQYTGLELWLGGNLPVTSSIMAQQILVHPNTSQP